MINSCCRIDLATGSAAQAQSIGRQADDVQSSAHTALYRSRQLEKGEFFPGGPDLTRKAG